MFHDVSTDQDPWRTFKPHLSFWLILLQADDEEKRKRVKRMDRFSKLRSQCLVDWLPHVAPGFLPGGLFKRGSHSFWRRSFWITSLFFIWWIFHSRFLFELEYAAGMSSCAPSLMEIGGLLDHCCDCCLPKFWQIAESPYLIWFSMAATPRAAPAAATDTAGDAVGDAAGAVDDAGDAAGEAAFKIHGWMMLNGSPIFSILTIRYTIRIL